MTSRVVAQVSNNRIQRHVPRLEFELLEPLEFVGDADEFRSPPGSIGLQMMEPAVIKARAAAKPCAATVDGDERYKDQVELPHGDALRLAHIGFKDAERIAAQFCIRVEAHELDRKSVV